jgi:Uma2 family endonuclease
MVSIRKLEPKTYDDYLALPEGVKAELIDGELFMSPQPKGRHVRAASFIGADLLVRFGRSRDETPDGPGGWWIFDEPECHLALDRQVVIPDVAGWRRERMPKPPDDTHKFTVVPDWVCEVISPSTQSRDFLVKMPRYREAGVQWLWLVYPAERRVDVFRNDGDEWAEATSSEGPARVKLPPFDAVELDTAPWWSDGD